MVNCRDGANLCDPSLNILRASYGINTIRHFRVRPFDNCTRLPLSLVIVCNALATTREGLSPDSCVSPVLEPEAGRRTFTVGKPRTPYKRTVSTCTVYHACEKGRRACSEHSGLFLSSSQSTAYSGTRGARLFAALLYSGERLLQCCINRAICVNTRI